MGQPVDLVLEGGGVKGVALVGAFSVLEERGYEVRRVAGSSAGAIVGALIASGMSAPQLVSVMKELDYTRFKDPTPLSRLGPGGMGASVLFRKGVYKGDFFAHWLDDLLDGRTFGSFRDEDPDPASATHEPDRAYRLMVTASDVSNQRLATLPLDYVTTYPLGPDAGGGADDRKVAEAVRCSMSIPFFYTPYSLAYDAPTDGGVVREVALMVDGGLLSDFPVQIFDRTDGSAPRWPTFGIKLSGRPGSVTAPNRIRTTFDFTVSVATTMVTFFDRLHIEDPSVAARTVFVDTSEVSNTDFGITWDRQEMLFERGRAAAEKFLETWDFDAWVGTYVHG